MKKSNAILVVLGALVLLALGTHRAQAQSAQSTLIPHATWDCGMPQGIPSPEAGRLVFEIEIPLDRVAEIGRTQYGMRRVAVGLEGSVKGPKLTGTVTSGALDFELTLANETIEIEQALVLQASDGSYIYARNAGTGPDAADVRVVMDFEAPNDERARLVELGHIRRPAGTECVGEGDVAARLRRVECRRRRGQRDRDHQAGRRCGSTLGLPSQGCERAAGRDADHGKCHARSLPIRGLEQARHSQHHPDHGRRR